MFHIQVQELFGMRKSIAYRKGYLASVDFEYVSLQPCSLRNDGFLYFEYMSITHHVFNRISPMGYMYRRKRRDDDWVIEDEKRHKYRLDHRTFSYIGSHCI